MNKCYILLLLGGVFIQCVGKTPFKPTKNVIKFIVYFQSRYRGICVGFLVSNTAVMTAAVCVTNPTNPEPDTRAINIVTGTNYRHPKRGVRVPITKILLPALHNYTHHKTFMLQLCPAILLLKKKIPDVLVEVPLRPVPVDYSGDLHLKLQEECMIIGWHFFYKGDKIYPVNKFLLQKTLRAQFVNIVKKHMWCDALSIKIAQTLDDIGYKNPTDPRSAICVRDGMYGAPLICRGRAVGMMMAPDAQWSNCTGLSNLIHLFSSSLLKNFMLCVNSLFDSEAEEQWDELHKAMYDDSEEATYDFVPAIYDKVLIDSEDSGDY